MFVQILLLTSILSLEGVSKAAPNQPKDKRSEENGGPILHARTKRSVEAFVREELNSLEQSDLFLDTYLTHDYNHDFLVDPDRVLLENQGDQDPVLRGDQADSTFLPPQSLRTRRPRSAMTQTLLTKEMVEKLKKIAKDPQLRSWVETAGSNLLNKLNAFVNMTEVSNGPKLNKSNSNSVEINNTEPSKIDPGSQYQNDGSTKKDDLTEQNGDSTSKQDGSTTKQDGSTTKQNDSTTKQESDSSKNEIDPRLGMSPEDLALIRFLVDMLKQGEGDGEVQADPNEEKVADQTCVEVPDILANDTRQQVRDKQGKRMGCYMNPLVDPCDDFYEYACGNWELYYPIPMDRGGYDTFEILREQLDLKLRNLLEAEVSEDDFKATKAVKTLYSSCMNTDEIERRGEGPLISLLDRLGGWPVLNDSWDEEQFDWVKLIGELRLFNNDILVSLWVGPDGKNSDQYIVQFDQSDLVLPSLEYYHQGSSHPIMKAYKNILVAVAVLLGADRAAADKQIKEIIDFEIQLSKIMTPPHERRYFSEMYEKMELRELSALVPQFNFTQYLDIVLPEAVKPHHNIVIYASKYFIKLTELVATTEKRTLANYILMRFIRHRINNLDKRFEKIQNELYRLLYGREEMPARWKFCIAYVNGNLGMAVGALFVNKYFDGQSKQDMLNLTQEVQQQFRFLLEDSDWLSSSTKQTAKMKLDAMIHNIGYPELVVDQSLLHNEIKGINFIDDEFFENVLENLKGRTQKEMSMLEQRVNRSIWTTTPAVVNAYYSRNRNQIMFPAGILQPPFYHKYFPKSMNYGGIGVVIGHEITHGFDDKGKQFDDLGNIHQWWDNTSSSNFVDKAQCIIDQYGRFEVSEVGSNLNGLNTQGENIADNGGIKQAYRAFRKWQETETTEDRLAHIQDLSPDQLFFLNFAQVWCGTARPEALRSKLKTAVHAPGKYRVLGTLSNSADFHRVFQCAPGSKMNPAQQCRVW